MVDPIGAADASLVTEFGLDQRRLGLSDSTVRQHRKMLVRFAGFLDGRALLKATPDDVRRWRNAQRRLSPATVAKNVSYLASFYAWVERERLGSGNPAASILRVPRFVAPGRGGEAVAGFVLWQRRRNLSPATITHRSHRLAHLAHWLNPTDLLDATAEDIDRWLDEIHPSPQTRYTYLSYVRAFYRWAAKQGLVKGDPTEDVVRPRLPRRVPRPIADVDLVEAIKQAEPRMAAFLALAFYQGMRCMEIAGLRVEDIHRDRNLIVIHGKGNKERVAPLHDEALRALNRYVMPRSGWVFHRKDGKPLEPATVSRYVSRHFRAAGVDATAHQARHTFATKVYEASGADLRLTQEAMGHASPTSTAIYAAFSNAKMSEVMARLQLDACVS